jgi:hypothetical protein
MQIVVPDADVYSIALIAFDRPFEGTLLKSKPISPALLHVLEALHDISIGPAQHPI